MKLLIINPGSTSTKISVFDEYTELFEESVFHDAPVLLQFPHVNGQIPFRKQVIIEILRKHGLEPTDIDVYVGRGGGAHPQHTGVTFIDETLYNDTMNGVGGSDHPAKLGVLIAYEMCKEFGGQMYTLNPTNVDEYSDYARLTGIKGVYNNAQAHVLNQKAVAEKHAEDMGKKYEECNFVVAHIDGGITVHAHEKGRMVDGNVGAGGDGAFTPTRIGSVPVLPLLDYIDAHSTDEVRKMCSRSGGFVSYFGTSDAKVVHKMVEENDPLAVLVWNTMIYQCCKQIGAMSVVLEGKVDGIILTGGLVRYADIVEGVKQRCGWIAPITVYPGEMEQHAMAYSVLKVLHGETKAIHYSGRPVWEGFPFIKD
ncbi:MAG: butyrate kinase [Ruminococcaceae bacterium]|nr:butyrate kinase [Oscillospiraceae bacterium]